MRTVSISPTDCPTLSDLHGDEMTRNLSVSDIADYNNWLDDVEARRNAEAEMDGLAQQEQPEDFELSVTAA